MSEASPETQAYRWVIVACSFLILFVSQGMTFGGITVFDLDLLAALEAATGEKVPLGDLKVRDGIMLATAGILGLAGGWLADRVGVKPLIIVGLSLLAVGNLAYSRVESLGEIYWIHAGFGLVLVLCGLMVNVYLISRWFEKRRGLAIGLVLAGTSLGNAFFPQLNTYLLGIGSWRQVFTWIALIPLALLPIAIFVLRGAPAGQKSGGAAVAKAGEARELPGYTLAEALRSRNFWIIGTMAFCTFYSILGMSMTTFNYLSAENYPPNVAATGVSIVFFGGLVGKIISGYVAESFGRKTVLLFSLGLMLTGSISLVLAIMLTSELCLWVGLVCFGTGWGGIYTLIQLLSADLFGMRSLGKILGVVNVLDTAGGALGPVLTARLYDATGSFLVSFSVITGLLVIATVAASLLRMEEAAYQSLAPTAA